MKMQKNVNYMNIGNMLLKDNKKSLFTIYRKVARMMDEKAIWQYTQVVKRIVCKTIIGSSNLPTASNLTKK